MTVVAVVLATIGGSVGALPVSAQEVPPWGDQTDRGCEVDGTYRAFLGRSPSAGEMHLWLAHLRRGGARSAVADHTARSEEWLARTVTELYFRALDRSPEPAGLAFWTDLLRRGATVQRLGSLVYGSSEVYQRAGATPDAYVVELYSRILDRRATDSDIRFWVAQVDEQGRARVAGQFFASRESREGRVATIYQDLLARDASATDRAYWAARLLSINDVRLAVLLAASSEFAARARATCALPDLALHAVVAIVSTRLAAGRPGTVAALAFGGRAPYSWSWSGLPEGMVATGPDVGGAPLHGGTRTVTVTVTDADGARSTVSFPLTVAPSIVAGYGAWIDVFDWTMSMSGNRPAVTLQTIDLMAREGVDVLYIQTSRRTTSERLIEESRSRALIGRARSHGMRVVGWYLPTFTDPAEDMARLRASLTLPIDAIGVDIESDAVADVNTRNQRLIALSREISAATVRPVLAITPNPVAMEDIVPGYWPGFPWTALAPHYDAWMPMAYWSYREPGSYWRDGYRYTRENIPRVRRNLGLPSAVVHVIGSPTSAADIEGMRRAIIETRGTGGSVYDWATTPASLHPALRPLGSL